MGNRDMTHPLSQPDSRRAQISDRKSEPGCRRPAGLLEYSAAPDNSIMETTDAQEILFELGHRK